MLFGESTSKSTFDNRDAELIQRLENLLQKKESHTQTEKVEVKKPKVETSDDALKSLKVLHASDKVQRRHMNRLFPRKQDATPNRVLIRAKENKAISLTVTLDSLFCSMANDLVILDMASLDQINPCTAGAGLCTLLSTGPGLLIASDSARGNFIVQYTETDDNFNSNALHTFCSGNTTSNQGTPTMPPQTTPPQTSSLVCHNCGTMDPSGAVWETSMGSHFLSFTNYSNNQDFTWEIESRDCDKQIVITFLEFDIEGSSGNSFINNCPFDFVEIQPMGSCSSSLGNVAEAITLCGNTPTGCEFYTGANLVVVQFKSDSSVTRQGFTMHFDELPRDLGTWATTTCPNMDGSGGSGSGSSWSTTDYPTWFTTPFPTSQPAGQCTIERSQLGSITRFAMSTYGDNCDSTSMTMGSSKKAIKIVNMDIEFGGADCVYDSLTISTQDGVHKLCGNLRGYVIYTEGDYTLDFISDSSAGGAGFEIFVENYSDNDTDLPFSGDSIVVEDPCTTDPSSRIVGGDEAEEHTFPWIISLGQMGTHSCGGSIVDRKTIVTAAHCIHGNLEGAGLTIVAGEHTLDEHSGTEQTIFVERVIEHPDYDPDTMDSDIAILKLKQKINYSDKVRPVCVTDKTPEKNTVCTAAGWGTLTSGGQVANDLQEVDLPVVLNDHCSKWMEDTLQQMGATLTDTMLCAGLRAGGVDSCQGDSGGPLTCEVDGVTKLVGATSWGIGCGMEDHPGLYAKVSKFHSWILRYMEGDVNEKKKVKKESLLRLLAKLEDMKHL